MFVSVYLLITRICMLITAGYARQEAEASANAALADETSLAQYSHMGPGLGCRA